MKSIGEDNDGKDFVYSYLCFQHATVLGSLSELFIDAFNFLRSHYFPQ